MLPELILNLTKRLTAEITHFPQICQIDFRRNGVYLAGRIVDRGVQSKFSCNITGHFPQILFHIEFAYMLEIACVT